MDAQLKHVYEQVSAALNELSPLFVTGARITFIVRIPGNTKADFMLTIDDLVAVKALIDRRIEGS